MGEKGNVVGDPGGLMAGVIEPSLVERITTTTTSTVVGVGQDFLETVKDKAVGAVADATVTGARDRMSDRDAPGDAPAGHTGPTPTGHTGPSPTGHTGPNPTEQSGPTQAEQTGPDSPPVTTRDNDSGS